jgi:Beta-ketoacyl synthase, N-terminal domain
MNQPIAIVGIACRYPDANSPAELWENVLAGRRAFRRIPDERLRLEELTQTQIGFAFEYVRLRDGAQELIARGRQRVACMRGLNGSTSPVRVPEQLRQALEGFAVSGPRLTGPVRLGTGGRA